VPGRSVTVRERGLPVASREVFRLTTPVVVWWVWVTFAVANVIDLAVQGTKPHSAFVIGAILLLVTGFAYALALRPRVVAGQDGLDIVNPFRDHHVPWPVIQLVDAGDWVRVHHTRDSSPVTAVEVPGQAIECWALYVSARAKRRDARGAPPPRSGGFGAFNKYAQQLQQAAETTRLPAEARYLASLPPAKAIAARLDTRATKERSRAAREDARARRAGADSPDSGPSASSASPASGASPVSSASPASGASSASSASPASGASPVSSASPASGESSASSRVTARWAVLPFAAVLVPALILLIAILT
jgi:Bacterial PH domain